MGREDAWEEVKVVMLIVVDVVVEFSTYNCCCMFFNWSHAL